MNIVAEIQEKVLNDEFEFSRHALDRIILRMISVQEVREAVQKAELIEDYPDDKYGPSCLLLGFTHGGRALHIQTSYPSRPIVKVITVYEPDTAEWFNFRMRKG